jgi:hypothetical protein
MCLPPLLGFGANGLFLCRDKNGVFIDPGGVHEGVEKINAIAELLFTQFEGYVFSVRGQGQSIHGVGRLP